MGARMDGWMDGPFDDDDDERGASGGGEGGSAVGRGCCLINIHRGRLTSFLFLHVCLAGFCLAAFLSPSPQVFLRSDS